MQWHWPHSWHGSGWWTTSVLGCGCTQSVPPSWQTCCVVGNWRMNSLCDIVTQIIFTEIKDPRHQAEVFGLNRMHEMWIIATNNPGVCQSVCHALAPCKHSWMHRCPVWGGDSWESTAHCVRMGVPYKEGEGKKEGKCCALYCSSSFARWRQIRCGHHLITLATRYYLQSISDYASSWDILVLRHVQFRDITVSNYHTLTCTASSHQWRWQQSRSVTLGPLRCA